MTMIGGARDDAHAALTDKIIGCAMEVHRELGPGLVESTYEAAMGVELQLARLRYERQYPVPVTYKGHSIGEYRLDLLIEDTVIVEVKSAAQFDPVFTAQMLTYLRVTGRRIGLLINFHSRLVKDGIKRFVF